MKGLLAELDHVSFEYARGIPVLVDLALSAQPGEILAILGPSGSGKTTALHLLAGFLRPQSGAIRLGGEVVSDASTHLPPRQRGIGMVFQDLALWPHLRVEAHLDFVLSSSTLTRHERRRQRDRVLELTELQGLGSRLPSELSGGEAQRLALARALVGDPRLLLLDEPFGALDERLRRQMVDLIACIHAESQATVVLVTHDHDEAMALASRVAVLVAGKLHQIAPPEEVYRFPVTREAAAMCGAVSLIEGQMDAGGAVRTALGSFPGVLASARPGHVTVSLRPEDIGVLADEQGAGAVRRSTFTRGQWQIEVDIAGVVVWGLGRAPLAAGSCVRVEVRGPVWAIQAPDGK